jgi:polyisoprenoid-binding protein YceI
MTFFRVSTLLLLIVVTVNGAAVRFDAVREKSVIAIRTGKAGLLSAFGAGHSHGIVATEFSARICADRETLEYARVRIAVPARALRIDTADARRAAGLTASGPGPADVATIQQKMLSDANLAAEQHPAIAFESASVQKKDNTLIVRGPLTIRGRSITVAVPLRIEHSGSSYRFTGEFPLRLSDYGIKPESVGGVVKVADEVMVLLDLTANPTQESCK